MCVRMCKLRSHCAICDGHTGGCKSNTQFFTSDAVYFGKGLRAFQENLLPSFSA